MISMKLMKWVAAGVLAGAPALGLARVHHVTTAAAPLAAVSTTPALVSAVKHAPAKLSAVKHREVLARHRAAVRASARKAVRHVAKPKVLHKHRVSVKSKKH